MQASIKHAAPKVERFKVGDLVTRINGPLYPHVFLLVEDGDSRHEFAYVVFSDDDENGRLRQRGVFMPADFGLFRGDIHLRNEEG